MTEIVGTFSWRNRSAASDPWSSWHEAGSAIYQSDFLSTTKSGSSTPGHKRLRNNGAILPVNPYTASTVSGVRLGTIGPAYVRRRTPDRNFWSWEERYTNWYSFTREQEDNFERIDVSPAINPDLIDQAVNDAISQATQSLIMAPVTALEARETLRMLKGAVKRLLNFASFIRDLAARRRESFSALWLEYRLGWTPFYYELIGFINIMNGKLKVGDRQHGSGLRGIPAADSASWATSDGRFSHVNLETVHLNATVRGFALAEVTDSTLARYGLNPVLVVWESITLSWLLDKFVSVGSWLSSLTSSMSGFKLVSSGISVKVTLEATKTRSSTPIPERPGYGAEGDVLSSQYMRTVRSFNRSPASGGGFPGFNRHFSAVSIADVVALIAQWYRR